MTSNEGIKKSLERKRMQRGRMQHVGGFKWLSAIYICGIVLLAVLIFMSHRSVPFMMDDIWYGTNLATGETLKNLGDVIEGQIWHFNNWGGRCITHGVLQLTLMSGELCADILNTLMTLLLAWMICLVAEKKNLSAYLFALTAIFALNANIRTSMVWQAGVANYVYATVWILLFIWPYLCAWREEGVTAGADAATDGEGTVTGDVKGKRFPLITLWMIPIGLFAGWSNENMGPSCFLLALATIIFQLKGKKKAVKSWMIVGMVSSLIGAILVVIAPGNFVRSATIAEKNLGETIWERFYSMLCAGTDFLFPICLLLTIGFLMKCVCLKQKTEKYQMVLLVYTVISFGAMVLSPHYPDRATFGTMVCGIVLFMTILGDMKKNLKPYFVNWLILFFWLYTAFKLIVEFILANGITF